MSQAVLTGEFSFVAELPKGERKEVASACQELEVLRALVEAKGTILPMLFAAKLLNISKQRMYQLVEEGRFEVIELSGQRFVTEADALAYAKSERKAGRPVKTANTKEIIKAAYDTMKEIRGKK